MPSQRRPPPEPPLEIPNLAPDAIERGIARLRKRAEEVRALDPTTMEPDDQRVRNAARALITAVLEIYGPNSPQYRDNKQHRIWRGGLLINPSRQELREGVAAGIAQTLALIDGLIADLEERLVEHRADPPARVQAAFLDLALHPRIATVSTDLFRDGHYRNAVLDSAVALTNYVKEKSRRHDLDGAKLMREVFSRNAPTLAFNDLTNQSDQDEQEGLMHLFEGAVLAFRNPRAHDLDPDTAEDALECIAALSMLAKRLDRAQRKP